ncbi:MAG: hypothetical protein ILA19_05100 [Bacilli bacterium]|nr:hypothetical protein [Bacilli bacterium]
MRRIKRRNSKLIFSVLILCVFMLSGVVGYSYLHETLTVEGNTDVNKNNWNIHFDSESFNVLENSAIILDAPTFSDNETKINFSINLDKPGNKYAFTVDVKNDGSIDGKLGYVNIEGLDNVSNFLDYSITYDDGVEIKQGDALRFHSKETIKVYIEFKKDITSSDLLNSDTFLNLILDLKYEQADGTEVDVNHTPDGQGD